MRLVIGRWLREENGTDTALLCTRAVSLMRLAVCWGTVPPAPGRQAQESVRTHQTVQL